MKRSDGERAALQAGRSARMVPHGDQCRCSCGSMLARMVHDGLELKCRKCKSLVLITHEELIAMYRELGYRPVPLAPRPSERPERPR